MEWAEGPKRYAVKRIKDLRKKKDLQINGGSQRAYSYAA